MPAHPPTAPWLELLLDLMQQRGYAKSFTKAAMLLGISRMTMYGVRKGRSRIRLHALVNAADALQLSSVERARLGAAALQSPPKMSPRRKRGRHGTEGNGALGLIPTDCEGVESCVLCLPLQLPRKVL